MPITSQTNYTGLYQVANETTNQNLLNACINEYESSFLYRIFGAELGGNILAYYNGGLTPPNAEYDFVINPFQVDQDYEVLISNGIVTVLTGLVYFEFMKHAKVRVSQLSGVEKVNAENALNQLVLEHPLYDRYNRSVKSINAIQKYIVRNPTGYDNFNGQKFLLNSPW